MNKTADITPGSLVSRMIEHYGLIIRNIAYKGEVAPADIRGVMYGKRITPEIARALGRSIPGTTMQYWLDIQKGYDEQRGSVENSAKMLSEANGVGDRQE